MQSEKPQSEWLYKGTLDCFGKIMKDEGAAVNATLATRMYEKYGRSAPHASSSESLLVAFRNSDVLKGDIASLLYASSSKAVLLFIGVTGEYLRVSRSL